MSQNILPFNIAGASLARRIWTAQVIAGGGALLATDVDVTGLNELSILTRLNGTATQADLSAVIVPYGLFTDAAFYNPVPAVVRTTTGVINGNAHVFTTYDVSMMNRVQLRVNNANAGALTVDAWIQGSVSAALDALPGAFAVQTLPTPQSDLVSDMELVVLTGGPVWAFKGGKQAGDVLAQMTGQCDFDLAASKSAPRSMKVEPSLGIVTLAAPSSLGATGYVRFDTAQSLPDLIHQLCQRHDETLRELRTHRFPNAGHPGHPLQLPPTPVKPHASEPGPVKDVPGLPNPGGQA